MRHLVLDPHAALVTARLEDIARQAAADGRVRAARRARARTARRWPASVASALRLSIGAAESASAPSPRRGAPCPTC